MEHHSQSASVGIGRHPEPLRDEQFWKGFLSKTIKRSRRWRWPSVMSLAALTTFCASEFTSTLIASLVGFGASWAVNTLLKRRLRKRLKRYLIDKGVNDNDAILLSNADARAKSERPGLEAQIAGLKDVWCVNFATTRSSTV